VSYTILLLALFMSLVGTFFLTALGTALRRAPRKEVDQIGQRFFYRPLHRYFFPSALSEGLFFATICAQNITRFCYAVSGFSLLAKTELFDEAILQPLSLPTLWIILSFLALILVQFVVGEYLPRILGTRYSYKVLLYCTLGASLYLWAFFPIIFIFLKITQIFSKTYFFDLSDDTLDREELIEMLQRTELGPGFDLHDRKLMQSMVRFKERIAREVMVPRVDVFSLPAEMPIHEAAALLEREGYSRIPIYRGTIDNITGVLMYKDVLGMYLEAEREGSHAKVLQASIESIQKPVLHTPETKKISALLQEFRRKQVHLAIVVDEYGGTEGIVTIEDILEEIVGEIADEYDEEESLFYSHPDGSWVIDARMNISDVEEELGITIPQEGDYDTVGGYIYHTTGMIPHKGFEIHQQKFDMEVLKSNDRSVEKVRIKPVTLAEEAERGT